MTLGVLWIRNAFPNTIELCVASDSRLTGGTHWDCAQKIFPLPRGDCLLAFAGDTAHAYPLVTQTINYVLSYDPALSRALHLGKLKGHLGRVINNMRGTLKNVVATNSEPEDQIDCELILAGYDWRTSSFKAWQLASSKSEDYLFEQIHEIENGPESEFTDCRFLFYGDPDAVSFAHSLLLEALHSRAHGAHGLNMEPFLVLADIIKAEIFKSVGGAPQIVKTYSHMNCMAYNIRWPNSSSPVFLYGRELLSYEKNRFLVLCPETLDAVRWSDQ
ncbi:MAG: hypothetical protein KC431_30645 [Myxococcales bacterium]|nr:hypothetical protein [Myxococcales bacterium]